ncbi:MAG: helix-turn-helix domain-containing protein [Deltaproteobacteria bacterium]|nr:helix-turn-helix domain-containing protein [Deltaproteobacteria bacterium]
MEKNNRYRIEAVYQAGQILRAVAESKGAIGSSDIAKSLGITVNTAFRMCVTLEELGFLRQIGDKYELGMGLALFWARKKATLEAEKSGIERDLLSLE